jgi:hypothetical protein
MNPTEDLNCNSSLSELEESYIIAVLESFENFRKNGNSNIVITQLHAHLNLLKDFWNRYSEGTSNSSHHLTIPDLEAMLLQLRDKLEAADFKLFLEQMHAPSGEKTIITQKKTNYSKKE